MIGRSATNRNNQRLRRQRADACNVFDEMVKEGNACNVFDGMVKEGNACNVFGEMRGVLYINA